MNNDSKSGTNQIGSVCTTCENDPCAKKRNFKIKGGIANYGYWCGGGNAPAKKAGLECKIPEDESKWPGWINENCLPQPIDCVDRGCMLHDLRLGKERKDGVAAWKKSCSAYRINRQLLEDFRRERHTKECNKWWRGRFFAWRGAIAFRFIMLPLSKPWPWVNCAAGDAAVNCAEASTTP